MFHEYSLLSEGEIWEGEVYCPKHGSRFDIRSGEEPAGGGRGAIA
jgi:nitrite reductase/ring-hydroxylating ferredoxin subunit